MALILALRILFVVAVFIKPLASIADCTGSISTESYKALEALYNSTVGANWIWVSSLPSLTVWHFPSSLFAPCSDRWQGLRCSSSLNYTNCEIEAILLPDRNLTGTIPSELGNLVNLEALDFSDNSLDGTIPSDLGDLMILVALDLYGNSLKGTIPSELGNLVKLTTLYLNNNSLDGTIPSELSNLVKLETFYLSENSLEGTISSYLGNLATLQSLYIFNNSLNGTIPSELGSLVRLQVLDLYDNSLEGTIPSELGNLTSLALLALYGNSLEGTIPSELGSLENLLTLFLYDNSLKGTIPSELGNLVNLEELDLYGNSLEGAVPSELGNLANLTTLGINDNSLSGVFPLSAVGWLVLESANLSTNKFSGPIELSAAGNLTSLQVLDLSLNRFTGTIPASVFTLPVLQTVILSQNCFSGSLPASMCLNDNLENIVLDLLTGNCGTADGDIFPGIVLRHYMTGTIPSCIWNSSSIRILHLLGNGLVGSLSDLSNASVLSVLAVGSNQLMGTIPTSFQRHNFTQLDVSINRLSGSLKPDLVVSEYAAVYDLSVNRLSGNIPSALYSSFSTGVINVLEGNLFGCQQDNIPPSDINRGSYQCGSVDFQYSLTAWAAGLVLCIVVVTVASDWIIQVAKAYRSSDVVHVLVGPLCSLVICLVGLVGYVTMKLSSGVTYTSTYAVQYWWTSTIAFVHGWNISVFLFLNLVAICAVFTLTAISLTTKINSVNSKAPIQTPVLYCFMAHLINVVIVTAVNTVYVLTVIGSVTSTALLAIQTVLGIFKLAWSSWAMPELLSRAGIADDQKLSHSTFMVLFVFLGAPFASSFCESSSCFLYVLTKPVSISFSLIVPDAIMYSPCIGPHCDVVVASPSEQLMHSSIPAPWLYSYQCSSAVITGYAPVLVLSYLASGIIIPFSIYMISTFPSLWPAVVKQAVPIFEFIYYGSSSAADLVERKSGSALGRRTVIKYILNLAVMMTFGLAVPLLAVAVMCDTIFNLGTVLMSLERFIEACEKDGLNAGKLMQEFWEGFSLNPREVTGCVYIVLGYVSFFWGLFAFDWIADVYGSLAGGLTMLVPLLLPTLIGYVTLRWKGLGEQVTVRRQDSNGTELIETSNPMMLPQTTNDGFNAGDCYMRMGD
jgi:Leucine-rich repeat (LRR) protein